MPPAPGKFTLPSALKLQTRRAQAVDAQFAAAVRRTCEETPQITACYLLDARKPETGETALLIAVTVIDESEHMDSVAQKFQAMLREFASLASKTYIMSSEQFVQLYAGSEFYLKGAG